jgi:hypothetical protein
MRLAFCDLQLEEDSYGLLLASNKNGVSAMKWLGISDVESFTSWHQETKLRILGRGLEFWVRAGNVQGFGTGCYSGVAALGQQLSCISSSS